MNYMHTAIANTVLCQNVPMKGFSKPTDTDNVSDMKKVSGKRMRICSKRTQDPKLVASGGDEKPVYENLLGLSYNTWWEILIKQPYDYLFTA